MILEGLVPSASTESWHIVLHACCILSCPMQIDAARALPDGAEPAQKVEQGGAQERDALGFKSTVLVSSVLDALQSLALARASRVMEYEADAMALWLARDAGERIDEGALHASTPPDRTDHILKLQLMHPAPCRPGPAERAGGRDHVLQLPSFRHRIIQPPVHPPHTCRPRASAVAGGKDDPPGRGIKQPLKELPCIFRLC